MRYLKVVGQFNSECELRKATFVVKFYDAKETEAVYEEEIKFLNRADGRFGEGIDQVQAERIDRFMLSRATSDLVTVFKRNLPGSPNGKTMELMAGGHNARGFATHVRFRFFEEDGRMIKELTVTPPQPVPPKLNCIPEESTFPRRLGRKGRPFVDAPDPVNQLCENYISMGW
ncbi:hypothetical protein [Pseudomonas fluorescens]|uniref:hypothetical protein n=1 Tax=Pseudomonas fluorescens TaxID=294 RepID=UPI00068A3A68|nr:hypothetical protein [Pseudomonas fluorescens]